MFRRRDRREEVGAEKDGRSTAAESGFDDLEELDEEAVEGETDVPTEDLESQAADYFAENDVWMYGPNAEAVLEVLDRLEELVPAEARPLAEAWQAIPKSDRDRARKEARKLAETDEEVGRYLQMVREAVGSWMAVKGPFPEFVNADPEWGRLCAQSGEAALDAATAVILEGKLEEPHYEALLEPWTQAMAEVDAAAEAAKLQGTADDESDDDFEYEEEESAEGEFGPNTDAVADFMTRLWLLTPEQVGRLVSGWQNASRDDLRTAHENLRALAEEDPEWRKQVRGAQEKLGPWLNSGRIQETSGFLGQSGQGESRKMAGPALADAVAALVLGDLLERGDAEALYGPWFNLIGAPPLPEPSPDEPAQGKGASAAKSKTAAKPPAAAKATSKPAEPTAKVGPAPATKSAPVAKAAKPAPAAKSAAKSAPATPTASRLTGATKPNVPTKK